jgi:sporadic carbohydrate cluster 2OG-Fe(II) oxygenase
MFLNKFEQDVTNEYLKNGYIIRPVADMISLNFMRSQFIRSISQFINKQIGDDFELILNQIHENITIAELNGFRLQMIREMNMVQGFREAYFRTAQPYLEVLVGNELAMQTRINLSIQFPNDESSLLPLHADTWSGDSPFEVVVWLPMVDCYATKAMYLLPPEAADRMSLTFADQAGNSTEQLYQSIRDDIKWLTVRFGEVLIFNQALPHGNRINEEFESRWSMNCRFKGIFTPYGDKKIGEFFQPITLRAASMTGISYQFPGAS